MDLKCPKCASENTQRLALAMEQGGAVEKSAKLHSKFGANLAVPAATFLFVVIIGVPALAMSPLVGVIVIAGIIYGGFLLRKKLAGVARSPYAAVSPEMRQNGFLCNRCGNQFVPQ
jgi:hypothetical protein